MPASPQTTTGKVATMGLILSSIRADLKKEEEGEWIESDLLKGVSFKVRSPQCDRFQVANSAMMRELSQKYKDAVPPPSEIDARIGKLYAEHILIDWKGIVDDEGKEIALLESLREEVLTDPAHRILRGAIEGAARRVALVDPKFEETAAKN